jgi:hypothetical protein
MPAKYVRLYSKGHKNEFGDYGREEPLIRDSGFRSVLVPSLLSDAPSVRSVPMIIFAISSSLT